jgi:hypothetical protein
MASKKSGGAAVLEPQREGVIDLEDFARSGRTPPAGKVYRIRIDKHKYEVAAPTLTGRQLLSLADKAPPERYMLSQKFRGGEVKLVALDAPVDLTTPGVERFMTLAKDQTEG